MKPPTVARRRDMLPAAPQTLEDTGLSFDAVTQLAIKILHLAGEQTGADLAARMGLRYPAIESVLQQLRATYLCDVAGGGLVGGPSLTFRITDAGLQTFPRTFGLSQASDHVKG